MQIIFFTKSGQEKTAFEAGLTCRNSKSSGTQLSCPI